MLIWRISRDATATSCFCSRNIILSRISYHLFPMAHRVRRHPRQPECRTSKLLRHYMFGPPEMFLRHSIEANCMPKLLYFTRLFFWCLPIMVIIFVANWFLFFESQKNSEEKENLAGGLFTKRGLFNFLALMIVQVIIVGMLCDIVYSMGSRVRHSFVEKRHANELEEYRRNFQQHLNPVAEVDRDDTISHVSGG